MTKQPTATVSIIMNCYNSDRFLKEAIDSVYAQTFKDWELIFWDNASTDRSAEIAKSYDSQLKYYLAEETTPLGEARNLAMKKAQGKYIAFLDCDDMYLPEKLEQQVKLMDEGDYALCYGSAIIIDEAGKDIRRDTVISDSGNVFSNLLHRYEINMQSVMIRRSILSAEALDFDTGMKYCPDYNLFMEIASRYPLGVIKDYLVKYRVVSDSLSKKTVDIASAEIRYSLDRILEKDKSLETEYGSSVEAAYNKLHYYDAISALHNNNKGEAINCLRPVVFSRMEYFLIYLMLIFPVPQTWVLKMLRR